MASIDRHPSGTYRVRFTSGRRRQTRTFDSKALAKEFVADLEDRLTNDSGVTHRPASLDPKNAQTIRYDDYAIQWFSTHKEMVKPTSAVRYKTMLNGLVIPDFGFLLLHEITPASLRSWQASLLSQGKSPRTVSLARTVFSMTLKSAIIDGYIDRNPFEGVPSPKVPKEQLRVLSEVQLRTLASKMKPRFRLMVLMGGYMGLRIGEMTALAPSDIDLTEAIMRVSRTRVKVQGEGWIDGPAKTSNSVRELSLPKFMVEEIRRHMDNGWHSDDYLFTGIHGGPVQPDYFRRFPWAKAVKAARLHPLRVHDLRHTAVSSWIATGASAKLVAYWAGHASVAYVIDTYGHLFGNESAQLAARLDVRRVA